MNRNSGIISKEWNIWRKKRNKLSRPPSMESKENSNNIWKGTEARLRVKVMPVGPDDSKLVSSSNIRLYLSRIKFMLI